MSDQSSCFPVRVLIADDHYSVRHSIAFLLSLYEDIELVGEAENGQVAVEESIRLRPHVVLMDLTMPIMNGIEAMRILHRLMPEIDFIVLSNADEHQMRQSAYAAGAQCYLNKDITIDQLADAIRQSRCQQFESNLALPL